MGVGENKERDLISGTDSGRREPHPQGGAAPEEKQSAGKGGAALWKTPRAALPSVEGGSADCRMRFLVALLLLSVAVAGKGPQPSPAHCLP